MGVAHYTLNHVQCPKYVLGDPFSCMGVAPTLKHVQVLDGVLEYPEISLFMGVAPTLSCRSPRCPNWNILGDPCSWVWHLHCTLKHVQVKDVPRNILRYPYSWVWHLHCTLKRTQVQDVSRMSLNVLGYPYSWMCHVHCTLKHIQVQDVPGAHTLYIELYPSARCIRNIKISFECTV